MGNEYNDDITIDFTEKFSDVDPDCKFDIVMDITKVHTDLIIGD